MRDNGTLPDAVVILRDQAEGCLLHQRNYIVAQSSVPGQSPNHSAGDVDWMLGLANDYLSSVNHVSLEGRVSQSRVDRCWIGQTLTPPPQELRELACLDKPNEMPGPSQVHWKHAWVVPRWSHLECHQSLSI